MKTNIPFQVIFWPDVEVVTKSGASGETHWQTLTFEHIRIRIVSYSENYMADHWCEKGHIVHCLEGSFISEFINGEQFSLQKGMTYIVSDSMSSHRTICETGTKLLIIDGVF